MELEKDLKVTFNCLENVLLQLNSHEYQRPLAILSNASIGQHTRHIIELFLELEKGYLQGEINYDSRQRDLQIESDIAHGLEKITEITSGLVKPNKTLVLINDNGYGETKVTTNYYRELIYNLEHMVHHKALIRIGLSNFAHIEIPEAFGIAHSTLKFRKKCAQ